MSGFLALVTLDLRITLRRGESVLLAFLIPLGFLLLFGFTGLMDVTVDDLVPGLFALSVISASFVGLAVATGFERKYLVLKRLGATPVPRVRIIAAKATAIAMVEVVQLALLWTVAVWALDWSPQPRPLPLVGAWLLGSATFAGLGMLLAGRLRAEATLALANGIYVVLLGIGGVIIPLDRFSESVAAVARLLPAAPLVDVFDHATGGPDPGLAPWITLAVWAVAAVLLAARTFTWEER